MDQQILTTLTSFIEDEMKGGRLSGVLFDNLDGTSIQKIWNLFDKIAMSNHGNYSAIFKDVEKYKIVDKMDFSKDETIEIGLLEGYLKCLLLQIDAQTYSQGRNGQLYNGKSALTFELIIEEIRNRSRYHKNKSYANAMVEMCGKLDEARRLRNNCKGHMTGHNGELLKSYITAFFVSTIIYQNIQNIWAGFQIIVYENDIKVQMKCGDIIISTPNNIPFGKPLYIPVEKRFFSSGNNIIITGQMISFKGNNVREITVKKGVFVSSPIVLRFPKTPPSPKRDSDVGPTNKPQPINGIPKTQPSPENESGIVSTNKPLPAYGIQIQGKQIANIIKVGEPMEISGERVRTIPQLKANQQINIWIYKHCQPGDMTPLANLKDCEKEPVLKKTISYAEAVNNETVTLKCTRDANGKVKLEVTWGGDHHMTELL